MADDKEEKLWIVSQENIAISGREWTRIMGGKVIETEAKKILNYGISQGLRQGVSEGLTQGKILGAIEFAKGMNMSEEQIVEQIVKKIGLSEDEAREKILEVSDK